jgi:hypothetical protein
MQLGSEALGIEPADHLPRIGAGYCGLVHLKRG